MLLSYLFSYCNLMYSYVKKFKNITGLNSGFHNDVIWQVNHLFSRNLWFPHVLKMGTSPKTNPKNMLQHVLSLNLFISDEMLPVKSTVKNICKALFAFW